MRHFRLTFKRDVVVLERKMDNGVVRAQELYPDKNHKDAELLDRVVNDLAKREVKEIKHDYRT